VDLGDHRLRISVLLRIEVERLDVGRVRAVEPHRIVREIEIAHRLRVPFDLA
jgi:hypothetical protein